MSARERCAGCVPLAHRPAGHRAPRRRAPRLTIIRHHRVLRRRASAPLYRLGVSASVFERAARRCWPLDHRADHRRARVSARLAEGRPGHCGGDDVRRRLRRQRDAGAAADGGTAVRRPPLPARPGLMESAARRGGTRWRTRSSAPASRGSPRNSAAPPRPAARQRRGAAPRDAALLPRAARAHPRRSDARGSDSCARAGRPRRRRASSRPGTWRGAGAGRHGDRRPHAAPSGAVAARSPERSSAARSRASVEPIARRLGVRPRGLRVPGRRLRQRTVNAVRGGRACDTRSPRAPATTRPSDRRFELQPPRLSEGACLGPGGRFSRRLALRRARRRVRRACAQRREPAS